MLDGKTSVITWILKTYLRKVDYVASFRCLDKKHYERYAERCPRCHRVLVPKDKRAFQQSIRIDRTLFPPSPCRGRQCNRGSTFMGHLKSVSSRPRYLLYMFQKSYDSKKQERYDRLIQEAIDDQYLVDMFRYRNRHNGWC